MSAARAAGPVARRSLSTYRRSQYAALRTIELWMSRGALAGLHELTWSIGYTGASGRAHTLDDFLAWCWVLELDVQRTARDSTRLHTEARGEGATFLVYEGRDAASWSPGTPA